MSRYYKIVVGAETATPVTGGSASNNAGATWTNMVNGRASLGAQQVEWDIWANFVDAPAGNPWVRIWGPSKAQISQAADFNGAPISVYAGMQNGLPLATATVADGQQGLIARGTIFQAYGNWQGINQTLEFVIVPAGTPTQSEPGNFSVNWLKGQNLSDVLTQTLQAAGYTIKSINISDKLILSADEHHICKTLTQLAQYVRGVSQNIVGGNYQGVGIVSVDNQLVISDGTVSDGTTAKAIKGQDMIGQATWLDAFTIQFNVVMRADLQVGNTITLPAIAGATALTSANSQSAGRAKGTFSGTWTVKNIRHIGNSRAPDANSWVTTIQAYSNTASQDATSTDNSSA